MARLRAELEAIKKRAHIGWRTGDRIAEIYGIADAALSPPATPEPAPAKTFGGCGRCRAATGRVNDNYCADCKAILAAAEAKATEPEFSRVRMACARCSSDVWVNSGEPIRGTVLCAKCPPLSDPRDTSKAEAKP